MPDLTIFDLFYIDERDIGSLKGEVSLFHNGTSDGNYAEIYENLQFYVKIPRAITALDVSMIIVDAHNTDKTLQLSPSFKKSDIEFDSFCFETEKLNYSSLFFYYFKIDSNKPVYGYRSDKNELRFSFMIPNMHNSYQITVSEDIYKRNRLIRGVMYHIFVDRFNRSGNVLASENQILIEDWDSDITEYPSYPGAFLKNNTFYGGNLEGIEKKLDYLKSLKVELIYLSPIFQSASNHKYDTGDYEKVDDMFGGNAALISLIKKAKEYGIEIILDGVFNHTGADSKYFNKYGNYDSLGAYQSKESPFYDWYKFNSHPNEYECWWGIDILPQISYESGNAEKYFLDEGGVVESWMSCGIKGFRLDVADELSDSFIEKMRKLLFKHDRNSLLFGEVWEDASNKIAYGNIKKYYLGKELSGVMNYPLKNGLISYIRQKSRAEIEYFFNTVFENMPKFIRANTMNLLGTHDTVRALTALAGMDPRGKSNEELSKLKMTAEEYEVGKRRLLSAYTILATLPGIPTIFYGDEVGVQGYSDPFNRKTFPWDHIDEQILLHYKKTNAHRVCNEAFYNGDFYLIYLDEDFLIFERKSKRDRFIVAYNNSPCDIRIFFSEPTVELYEDRKAESHLLKSECAYVFKAKTKVKFKLGC